MGLNINAKNIMLDSLDSVLTHVALFDETGTELSGDGYARQALTWGAAADGSKEVTNTPTFNVPAAVTVATIRFFNAVTAGTEFANYDAVDESYSLAGTYTINNITVNLDAVV